MSLPDNGCTTCPICERPGSLAGASDVAKVHSNVRQFQHESFTVWRCTGCNSLHSAEAVDLNAYYAKYPVNRLKANKAVVRTYAQRLREMRRFGFAHSGSVLDYGCGNGLFVKFMQKQGIDAYGYDAFVKEYANRENLSRQYDTVVSYDVIEHVDDPSSYFAQLSELTASGGLLVLGTPNADGLRLDRLDASSWSLHQPYHRHILSKQALLDMGTRHGFTPLGNRDRYYIDTPWPFVNSRFMQEYARRAGNVADVVFEKPKAAVFLSSPSLWFYALFGYFFPPKGLMTVYFRKT